MKFRPRTFRAACILVEVPSDFISKIETAQNDAQSVAHIQYDLVSAIGSISDFSRARALSLPQAFEK